MNLIMSLISGLIGKVGAGSIVSTLLGAFGSGAVIPVLEQGLLNLAKDKGEEAVDRALHFPRSTIEAICAETGKDVETAITMQDAAAKAETDFLMYLAVPDEGALPDISGQPLTVEPGGIAAEESTAPLTPEKSVVPPGWDVEIYNDGAQFYAQLRQGSTDNWADVGGTHIGTSEIDAWNAAVAAIPTA